MHLVLIAHIKAIMSQNCHCLMLCTLPSMVTFSHTYLIVNQPLRSVALKTYNIAVIMQIELCLFSSECKIMLLLGAKWRKISPYINAAGI